MVEAVEDLEAQHGESGTKRIAKDLFGGAVGGVAQVLIGTSAVHHIVQRQPHSRSKVGFQAGSVRHVGNCARAVSAINVLVLPLAHSLTFPTRSTIR